MAGDQDAMGPVSYVIVEFPGNRMTGEGLAALVDLDGRDVIKILDVAFVSRDDDGSMFAVAVADLDQDGELDVAILEGAASGLLDQADYDEAAEAIKPGCSAGIVLFENRWAKPFVAGMRKGGAELVAAGYIPLDHVAASLDAAEAEVEAG